MLPQAFVEIFHYSDWYESRRLFPHSPSLDKIINKAARYYPIAEWQGKD